MEPSITNINFLPINHLETSLPVLLRNAFTRTYSIQKAYSILVNNEIESSKICKIVPISVEHNCTFVVDKSQLANAADVCADDCGVWKNNGVHPCIVKWNDVADVVIYGAPK
uniref:Uncharacterized protein n=1 Tax=Amphimedon queenslandica TaxID=400682 RepID=A0A1X7V1K9_AMPQE